jgi:hypothetical protein
MSYNCRAVEREGKKKKLVHMSYSCKAVVREEGKKKNKFYAQELRPGQNNMQVMYTSTLETDKCKKIILKLPP